MTAAYTMLRALCAGIYLLRDDRRLTTEPQQLEECLLMIQLPKVNHLKKRTTGIGVALQ